MANELPETDTRGKEVHAQDDEEHVVFNSMAASEINGDLGIETQGDESEEGTHPVVRTHDQIRQMTKTKELPEMDTGKEVHAQDGEEHMAFNSMAASGEELEGGMHPDAIGEAAGASYLHPLVLEDSQSDSDVHAWIDHPSSSPKISVMHAAYFLLLGAGFDGMAVRELFRSRVVRTLRKATFTFEKPVEALTKTEMEFEEKVLTKTEMESEEKALTKTEMESEEMHESMVDLEMPSWIKNTMTLQEFLRSTVHPWKKVAFEKPVEVLAELEMEIEETLESMGNTQLPSQVRNQDDDSNGEQL